MICSEICDEFILVGHVKDTVTEKDGVEVSAKELDLVGKLSKIVCGLADAVGYVYRKGNETHISFKGGTSDTIMEARAKHMAGKDIVIAPVCVSLYSGGAVSAASVLSADASGSGS